MKSLRIAAVTFALCVFPLSLLPAYGQQEVDPDHFEQASAPQPKAYSSKQQNHHQKAQGQAQHHSNVNVASKHSHKTKHQHPSA